MGFGDQLVHFSQEITGNANSSIIINGKATKTFDISRSVRQGDPLSPLFFILIMQVLGDLITDRMELGGICGVQFEENINLAHQFFADNVTSVIEVNEENINNFKEQFDKFGQVSRLKCDWHATSAIYLANDELP